MIRRLTLTTLLLACGLVPCANTMAQSETSTAESSGFSESSGSGVDDPLRIMGFVGGGIGFRLVRNLDFNQEFITPGYLDVGAAAFLPGLGLRHGAGMAISTSLSGDALLPNSGVGAGAQWSLTPSYHLLIPFQRLLGTQYDEVQLQIRLGLPLVFSERRTLTGGTDFTLGGEVAAALHYKFLAGLGVYFEAQAALYAGSGSTVHPVISIDAGLVFDYEVL